MSYAHLSAHPVGTFGAKTPSPGPTKSIVIPQVTARYAIYFAPDDDSELGVFGATVLRRHALDSTDWLNPAMPVEFPQSSVWSDRIQRPAHYGFHATIKAPFELSKGQVSDNLIADVADFCQSQQTISLDGLAPIRTNRYDALAFEIQPEALRQLASDCVMRFDKYRAPLTDADIVRRDPASLTEREIENMHSFGYPYILDDFNFHMTLSGRNDHNDADYLSWLRSLYQSMVTTTPLLDRLCVFYQPDRATPFVRIEEFQFGLSAASSMPRHSQAGR